MGGMYAVVGLSGAAAAAAVRDGRVAGGAGDSNLLSLILLSGGAGGASLLDLGIIGEARGAERSVVAPFFWREAEASHLRAVPSGLFGFSTLASIPGECEPVHAGCRLSSDAGASCFLFGRCRGRCSVLPPGQAKNR